LDSLTLVSLETIEDELNRVDLFIMSIGNLSRLVKVYSNQIEKVTTERDKHDDCVKNRFCYLGKDDNKVSNSTLKKVTF